MRGLRPELRFLPTGAGSFGSWDGGFSDSRQLRIAQDGNSFTLENEFGEIVAVRADP